MYKIIADEPDFIVISKSGNVHFHSQDGSPGVVAKLSLDLGKKFYPVHRLDTVTSGLFILAKTSEAAREFSQKFSGNGVQKYYLAVAQGKPKKKQGWIIGDMDKSRRGKYKLLRSRKNPAITQFFSKSVFPGSRLYILKPLSGKTHQLRVALASLGTPILGDTHYGGDAADRAYLHAWYLEFTHKNKPYCFSVDPQEGELFQMEDLRALINEYRPPSQLPWPEQ